MAHQPQGKSMKELRSIVKADLQRLEQLGELWSYLTDDEQVALLQLARRMAGEQR